MADIPFEIILDGGGPWGFRLQGGKDFGVPLNVARVTPGSKAAMKKMNAGDFIHEINGVNTDNLSHMEAQNLIKHSGSRLQMKIRKGKGVSIADQNAAALGTPKVLTETTVVHSAHVDHGFNSKPRVFGAASPSSSPVAQPAVSSRTPPPAPTVHTPKFDPGAYARRKKEELEQRKKEQNVPVEDSEILKMINATHISKTPSPPPLEKADDSLQPGGDPGAFRMVYSGRDIHEEVSPGSKSVISSLKEKVSQDRSGLNSESKVPSRVFQMLQKQLDEEEVEDLPPPPPELIDEEYDRPSFGNAGPGQQSRTFRHLQDSIASGENHQSVFSRPPEERNKAVPLPGSSVQQSAPQQTIVNPIPKAPMPTGPNFKISSPKAPSFKSPTTSPQSTYKPTQYSSSAAPPSAPSFKPSTVPQPVNSPQVTTGKVPSAKEPTLPVDPSRTPICHNCDQQIRGPFVSAIGKTWHPEHFCCHFCRKSLQNQGFVEEANKLYCEQCFNSNFAPKCFACGNSIIGNCINAVGKTYHPDHFRCEKCGKSFASEGFLVEMGKPYCESCHDSTFGVKCAGCARSITGGQHYVEALSQNWHTDCFKCQACSVRLEGASFYVVKGRPYCGQHKSGM